MLGVPEGLVHLFSGVFLIGSPVQDSRKDVAHHGIAQITDELIRTPHLKR